MRRAKQTLAGPMSEAVWSWRALSLLAALFVAQGCSDPGMSAPSPQRCDIAAICDCTESTPCPEGYSCRSGRCVSPNAIDENDAGGADLPDDAGELHDGSVSADTQSADERPDGDENDESDGDASDDAATLDGRTGADVPNSDADADSDPIEVDPEPHHVGLTVTDLTLRVEWGSPGCGGQNMVYLSAAGHTSNSVTRVHYGGQSLPLPEPTPTNGFSITEVEFTCDWERDYGRGVQVSLEDELGNRSEPQLIRIQSPVGSACGPDSWSCAGNAVCDPVTSECVEPPTGESCDDIDDITGLPHADVHTTEGHSNGFSATRCSGYSTAGADRVFRLRVPPNATLEAYVEPLDEADLSLYLVSPDECGHLPTCLEFVDDSSEGQAERLSWTNDSEGLAERLLVIEGHRADGRPTMFQLTAAAD